MSKLIMVLETPRRMEAKGNADKVLVQSVLLPGIPGPVWLNEVPIGGAEVLAVEFSGYSGVLDDAAHFCACLRTLPKLLLLDGVEVDARFEDGIARLVPVKSPDPASPDDDIEEARRRG
jgi:hypothetical protein